MSSYRITISAADWDWTYNETVCNCVDKETADRVVAFLEHHLPDQYNVSKSSMEDDVSSLRDFKKRVWHAGLKDHFR